METQPVRYVTLDEEAFRQEYRKAFQRVDVRDKTEEDRFRHAVRSVQGAVEEALLKKWTATDDFQVGWDFSYCYHTCGGIYSERIFCADYIQTLVDTMRSIDGAGRWTYHTCCEIIVNPDGKTAAEAM